MFAKDENNVYVYGMDSAKELNDVKNIKICSNLEEIASKSNIILGGIPFSKDEKQIFAPFSKENILVSEFAKQIKSKTLIAGGIKSNEHKELLDNKITIIDLMKKEELAVLNTIATAEGTIEVIISNTQTVIHGSNILILGFGRVAKVLAKKLKGLDANITCAVRKREDMAWIKTFGYSYLNINNVNNYLNNYDIIINTVPSLIIDKEKLSYIRKECLIVDLASAPGGIDRDAAKDNDIHVEWALALPGKVAPLTSAMFIKQIIYNCIEKIRGIKKNDL